MLDGRETSMPVVAQLGINPLRSDALPQLALWLPQSLLTVAWA